VAGRGGSVIHGAVSNRAYSSLPVEYDVAIIGGGPAGSSCAAFCAASGLRVVLIEREKFPREKVCGDCLNPECWSILQRLGIDQRIRASPHGALDWVEFINLRDRHLRIDLPRGETAEIAIKRSAFDSILLERARELGAEVREASTLTSIEKSDGTWKLTTREAVTAFCARLLVAADGRNSTVARLLGLLPHVAKERVALQAHISLPRGFGNHVVLQLLPGGYSGQAPVTDTELNLCLVGKPKSIRALQDWAPQYFNLASTQTWRTITPLTRSALPPALENVLLAGDAARVVEPFTGEGIFYALRSGELAAAAAKEIIHGNAAGAVRDYIQQHRAMYRGRLWINALARAAVVSPGLGSVFFQLARLQPALLGLLTRKIVRHPEHG
jgi:geranylgeranyl reductase family protein